MVKFFLSLGMAALAVAPLIAAEPDVRIGMYQGMFRDVPPAMVVALAKPLQGVLEKTMGVTGTAELLPDSLTLAQQLDAKKIDLGVFHGVEYAWIKARFSDLEPLIVAVPNGGKLTAVVVVHIDSKATRLEDLKDITVTAPRGLKAHCELFYTSLRKGLPESTAKLVNKSTTPVDEALTEIAGGTPGAVLLDESSFNAYRAVNTGSGAVLKVLARSENFPLGVLVVRKNGMSDETRRKIVAGMTSAHTVPAGKPLMFLWSLKCFETVPTDYDDQLTEIVKVYPAPKVKVVEANLTGRTK